jgi:hypothetical protein
MSEQLELFPTEVGYELSPQEVEVSEMEQLPTIEDAEWCFQFFNNEPIVFAWQELGVEPNPLVLQINPVEGEGLNFQQNGMTFRIFPREISKETKLQRLEQNENKNKEA